jgi:hypothetical protein
MINILNAIEKRDIALRCHNALIQAVAFGAKLQTHPQTLEFWLDGSRTVMDIAREAQREIDGPTNDCPRCNGQGEIQRSTPHNSRVRYDDLSPDDYCHPCPDCKGKGKTEETA